MHVRTSECLILTDLLQAQKIANNLYASEWYGMPGEMKDFIIIIGESQRQVSLTGGRLFRLDLATGLLVG